MTALEVNARQNHSENKDQIQPTLTYEKIETENPEASLKILTGLLFHFISVSSKAPIFMTPKLGPYGFIRL